MSKVLGFLGLKRSLQLTLKTGKAEFITSIENDLKPKQIFLFDILDSNKKKFYGKINHHGFKLRLSNNLSSSESPFAKAVGTISGGEQSIILNITIIAWNWFIVAFMLVIFTIIWLSLKDILASKSYEILILLIPVSLLFVLLPIRKGEKNFETYLRAELKEVSQ